MDTTKLFLCGILFSTLTLAASTPQNTASDKIFGAIKTTLAQQRSALPTLEDLEAVLKGYQHLSRTETPPETLLELKYMVSHWRETMTTRLLKHFDSAPEERGDTLNLLREIKPRFTDTDIETLLNAARESSASLKKEIALAIADFGKGDKARQALFNLRIPEAVLRHGPSPIAKIKPYQGTNLRGLDWLEGTRAIPEIDRYQFQGDHSVTFRGELLETGDIFLADLALPHDGVLSSFLSPRSLFTHSAMFVVIKSGDRKIPAVLEMHEKGNRLVPLANFLANHTYYAEAYRYRRASHEWREKISREVRQLMLNEKISYDFQARDIPSSGQLPEERKCTTCTTLLDLILKRTGTNISWQKSRMNAHAKPNFDTIQMPWVDSLLTPTDIMREPEFRPVAIFDNRELPQNLARELVIGNDQVPGTAGHFFATHDLAWDQLPLAQTMFRGFEVSLGQRTDPVSRVVQSLAGFQPGEVTTSASPRTIAFYLISNDAVGNASKRLKPTCDEVLKQASTASTPFSLAEAQTNSQKGAVNSALEESGLTRWYRSRQP